MKPADESSITELIWPEKTFNVDKNPPLAKGQHEGASGFRQKRCS